MAVMTGTAPALEAAQKGYLGGLTSLVKTPTDTSKFAPEVQRQSDFSMAAQQELARQAGLGAITFDPATGGVKSIGAGTGVMAFEPFLQQAAQFSGPQAYQQFMSPYQQDVIDTTLKEFDVQAAKGIPSIAAQAVGRGVLGGGREGVVRSEHQQASDRNRAALQAQLLQSGFGQAQQAAQQAFANQQALAQQQQQLATQAPALFGQQISALGALGTQQQAQEQALRSADQQLAFAQQQQPLQLAQQLGQGVMGLISGYPAQFQTQSTPTPSPLQTALGAGATLAGVYRAFR